MTFRKYVVHVTTFLITLSGITVAINYFVDPYLVFGSHRVAGLNAIKADINDHTWLMKSYHPMFGDWDTLLLGNSRTEIGFDPEHRCFKENHAKVYNLGVPGANVGEQVEFAANVIYQQPIDEIILSVDFGDFLIRTDRLEAPSAADAPSFSNLRFHADGTQNPDYRWRTVKDRYKALYTLDALTSSLRTIAMQVPTSPDRDKFGFNPARDFANSVDIEGPQALFAQKIDVLDAKFSANWSLSNEDGSPSAAFSQLNLLLEIARDRGIRVTVIASPFHATYWAILKKYGLYQQYTIWQQLLAKQLSQFDDVVTYWDFTTESRYSTEQIPDAGIRSGPLKWYWEPVHFRRELGDLMLDTVLADRCEQAQAQFGIRIQ